MKETLLINSPIYIEKQNVQEDYLPPLGLGYIATVLKNKGMKVRLIDCVSSRMGINEIIDEINRANPPYVGINIFTQNYELVKEIVEKTNSNATFIIGGQVTKFIYNDIIKWDTKSKILIVIGEGELAVPALVNNTYEETPIIQTENREVYKIDAKSNYYPADISSIALDRSFFLNPTSMNHYSEVEAAIITSRGCTFDCAFCAAARSLNMDITIRYRTEQSIIEEIKSIILQNPEVCSIRVFDDLFLRNKKSINSAINIFSQFPTLAWRGMAHVLTVPNESSLLERLKESGCKELFFGIESGSQRIREKINKRGSIEQVEATILSVLEIGIDVKAYFIYGFPEEELSDFEATYNLAKKLFNMSKQTAGSLRMSVFQFRPYHGTKLYNEILGKYGYIDSYSSNEALETTGRKQFNFQARNYSNVSDEVLNEFTLKTQELSEESKE